MKVLGIIPARGGSKKVPQKNIRLLAGKPLISYTIEAALKSKHIDRLIVSTDDQQIAKVAKKYGAEVPFLRPAVLAQDDTPDQPVFQHALKILKDQDNYEPDIVLNLRPTTPFKSPQLIDKVIERLKKTKAGIVRTMSPVEGVYHPYWMYSINNDARAIPFLEKINISDYYQRQLLPEVYRINGVVDAYTKPMVVNGDMLSNDSLVGLAIPEEESIDIDSDFDFLLCEFFLEKHN